MAKTKTVRSIGILTAGGDCPGLNAAIRAVTKAAISRHGFEVIGIRDGFRGLIENRVMPLDTKAVSGILTNGGTILGTSRDKPHRMHVGDRVVDMTETAVENARRHGIDCLVCLGGAGTQKNAYNLVRAGLPCVTLPKTIDNDVAETDVSFGFDTAMAIATEAIDRLHTTATSHNRLIVVELMGHNAGWLALGAGMAGGADVILIPEIAYDLRVISEHLFDRRRHGKRFSIVVVAEGARSVDEVAPETPKGAEAKQKKAKKRKAQLDPRPAPAAAAAADDVHRVTLVQEPKASRIARQLQQVLDMEARVTSLGHVQRGGTPTASDRILCTRLGTAAAALIAEGITNVMVGVRGDRCVPVPLEKVAGFRKTVPRDHPWLRTAELVETCFGEAAR